MGFEDRPSNLSDIAAALGLVGAVAVQEDDSNDDGRKITGVDVHSDGSVSVTLDGVNGPVSLSSIRILKRPPGGGG